MRVSGFDIDFRIVESDVNFFFEVESFGEVQLMGVLV